MAAVKLESTGAPAVDTDAMTPSTPAAPASFASTICKITSESPARHCCLICLVAPRAHSVLLVIRAVARSPLTRDERF